jgi:signal peptide peptidase SppA
MRGWIENIIPERLRTDIPVVPVLRLTGTIGFSTPLKPGLTLSVAARNLERAFGVKKAKAVALVINSPGGSPVQSHLIYKRIRQLSEEKKIPVLAFVEDVGASGGYMIACAADEILCDASSILGSIGVVGATFGLDKAIKKLGIERRVYTAGKRKVMLDPFLPESEEDVRHLRAIQENIHQSFIALVKERRGGKLKGQESALFSGEYWDGKQAVELGLADGIDDLRGFLRARYGEKVRMPLVAERGWFGRRMPGVGMERLEQTLMNMDLAESALSAIEARAIWARYGL